MPDAGSRLENFIKAGAVFLGVLLLVLSVSSFNVISHIRDYLEKENARRLTAIAAVSARELQGELPDSIKDPYYIYAIKVKQSLAGAALLDRRGNVVFDANNNYKPGQFPAEIAVSRQDIERAWSGYIIISPVYKRKSSVIRSVYFPVKGPDGLPALVGEISLDAAYIDDLTQQSSTYSFIKGMAGVFLAITVFFVVRASSPSRRKNEPEEQGERNNVSFVVDTFHSLMSQLKEKEKELQELKDRAEERARAVESYNESVLKNIQSGVMTFGRDGKVITANDAAGKILELAPGEITGDFREVFDRGAWLTGLIEGTLSSGRPARRGEGELKLKGGGVKWLGAGASALFRDGSLEGVILVFTDITEVKELRERMEMKERIAVLGEMSAGIAHELRNPMGVISGYSEYLAKRLKDDAGLNDAAESIRAEIRTMDEIIREFMNFSQPTELNITEVDLNGLIEEALRALPAISEKVSLSFKKSETLPLIEGDGVLLRQAFLNIIKNALEAMPDGGGLTIKTEFVEAGRPGNESGLPPGRYIRAQIADTGEGIEEKALKKIFMPFFTTKAKGTGLGLALVQKILVYHGGRVSVKSAKGKGTVFTVFMPVKP